MFDETKITNFKELFADVKRYFTLQQEYVSLVLTEKLTILLSAIALFLIVLAFGFSALFFFLFSFAYILEPYVGGLNHSFAIIGAFYLLLIGVVVICRKRFIITPMVRFLATLFLTTNDDEQ